MEKKIEINEKIFPEITFWRKWAKEAHSIKLLIFMNPDGDYFPYNLLAEKIEEVTEKQKVFGNEFIAEEIVK